MTAIHTSLRQYHFPILSLAILVMLGAAATMIWGVRGVARSTGQVEHSYRVVAAIHAAVATVREAESHARSYRITGSTEQLAEYLAALGPARHELSHVVSLARGDAVQHALALQLRERTQARLADITRLVALQQEEGAEQARAASMSGTGVALMKELTDIADEMVGREQALLDSRRAASRSRTNLLTTVVVLGVSIPMLLLALLLAGLTRENRRSRELELEAQQAVRELEDSLVQRDRLSEQRRRLGIYAGLLQSCNSIEEAASVTARVISELWPASGGRCYVLRASQNLAETASRFGDEPIASADLLQPEQCWALRRGQPHRTDPRHGQVRCDHLDSTTSMAGVWTLCLPLMAQGASLGMLHVSALDKDVDADVDSAALEAIAEQLSLALANLHLRDTLRVQSIRDPLTGLFNRRYLEENLMREVQRCERRGLPLSVLMLDVDHFKRFNDEHGHAAGDALLSKIGQTLSAMTRSEDIACRYGGEEFTIVLPETDAADARHRAEDIRAAIASTTVQYMRQSLGPNTASIGVATFPQDGDHPERLLAVADAGLYRAKSAGRNQVAGPIQSA
ncbi:MAG: diguanylate cyclase [Pseudomonadota bacterium]|nr:diguanylate cyclase [Pseudomonadota bacterium]